MELKKQKQVIIFALVPNNSKFCVLDKTLVYYYTKSTLFLERNVNV